MERIHNSGGREGHTLEMKLMTDSDFGDSFYCGKTYKVYM